MITAFVGQRDCITRLHSQLPMANNGCTDSINEIELRQNITCFEKNNEKVRALFSLFHKNLTQKKKALSEANKSINKKESAKELDNAAWIEYHKWTENKNSCDVRLENTAKMLSWIIKTFDNLKIPELEPPKMFDVNWWHETSSRLVSQYTVVYCLSLFNI